LHSSIFCSDTADWVNGVVTLEGRIISHPLNFSLSGNCFLARKFSYSNTEFGVKIPNWENLGGVAKLKLCAPIISSIGNLQPSVWKSQPSAPQCT